MGFDSYTELSLRIDPTWQPVPDVVATRERIPGPYPTTPVKIVAEILSQEDSFVMVEAKCERCALLGIAHVFVLDSLNRKAWRWDRGLRSLILADDFQLGNSLPVLWLAELWTRFETKL